MPPDADWDDPKVPWSCNACGTAMPCARGHEALARLRGMFSSAMNGKAIADAQAECGYPRPPAAVDVGKPPSKEQIARLTAILGRAPEPNAFPAQVHAWAALCAFGEGRA